MRTKDVLRHDAAMSRRPERTWAANAARTGSGSSAIRGRRASGAALQPRQIFKVHRDAAESTRAQDLEAGGGAGSALGDQLEIRRFWKIH